MVLDMAEVDKGRRAAKAPLLSPFLRMLVIS
jgi:hypothetical protein